MAQREPHLVEPVEREVDLALDDGAVGDTADRRHAAHDLGGFAFGLETADRDRTLADRVDVAIGAQQRCDQQGAALQALAVAERGDGDVDAGALGGEGRQVGGDHHRRDVFQVQLGGHGNAGIEIGQAFEPEASSQSGRDVQADHCRLGHQRAATAHGVEKGLFGPPPRECQWADGIIGAHAIGPL